MTALRLLNTESQDKADYLHNQLITDINVPSTYWECAESYLKGVGIYDVFLIEEQDFRNYKIFLRETGNFTKKQVFERTGFLRNLKKTLIQEEYKELLNEIEQCNTVQERLKGNVRNFLIRQRIHHVKEIDYRIRELYESELRRTKTSSKGLEYLKTLDRIKQFDIRKEMETLSGRNKERLKYEGQVIFLPYIPDQDIASDFDYIQDKSELVWDFSQKAPETLKKQIFQILCYALRNIKDSKDRRVRYLLPLRWMYEFCVEEGIEDIERLELEQIKKLETIVARKVANVKNSMQIVDNSRKMQMIRKNDIRDENGELLNFGTHTFRHCYGKKLTEMHIDDWMIARLLGHKTLQSVHHYRKIGNKIMADETRAVREKIDMILMDVVKEWDGYEI